MGKKKKKGLIKKVDFETRSMLSLLLHGEDVDDTQPKSLIDEEEFVDPERMTNIIKRRVENGEHARDIAYYSHKVLTAVVAHAKIEGRSQLTTKMLMSKALVKHFGGKKEQWKK